MARNDAYATAAQYRAALNRDDNGEDAEILEDLKAVARWLDRELGSTGFNQATETRLYVPDSHQPDRTLLFVDELVSVTTIKEDEDQDESFADETAWATADFELLPRNAAVGEHTRPYTMILATLNGAKRQWLGVKVQIVGTFGWPAVPIAIQRASIQLTGIWRLESPRATSQITEMGTVLGTSRMANEIVERVAKSYTAVTF